MDVDEYTDVELVEKTLENKEFFRHVIEQYETVLRRYVRRISNISDHDVDDVLQEVFIKVYKNLRAYDEKTGSFSSWIYRITHNTTISMFRRKAARPEDLVIDGEAGLADRIAADDDIIKEAESVERSDEIHEAIGRLPDSYRDYIILFYLEEKSYKEISDILKVPMGTVATKINRAKKKLKQELTKSNEQLS